MKGATGARLEALEDRRLLSGDYAGSVVIAGAGDERVTDVIVDVDGNRFVLGTFTGTCDFAPGRTNQWLMTSRGGADVFVARYNRDNRLIWARQLGGAGDEEATAIHFSDAGNNNFQDQGGLIITGAFTGTADFNPTASVDLHTSNGKADIFVWSLSPAGKLNWARTVGGPGYDVANGLAIYAGRDLYVGGSFRETVNFRTGKAKHVQTSAGARDGFVWKLRVADGVFQDIKQVAGHGDDAVTTMADAPLIGQVLAGGYFSGTINFGFIGDDVTGHDVSATSVGADDVFLAGFLTDHAFFDLGSFDQYPEARTARLAGIAQGQHNLDAALTVGDVGSRDIVIWRGGDSAMTIDGAGDAVATGIACDLFNNLWLTGTFTGSILRRTSSGGTDIFVAKFDLGSLLLLNTTSIGGTGNDTGRTLLLRGFPNVMFVAGAFRGTIDLDPSSAGKQLRTSEGGDDAFFVEVKP